MSLSIDWRKWMERAGGLLLTLVILDVAGTARAQAPEDEPLVNDQVMETDEPVGYPPSFQNGWSWFQWSEQIHKPIVDLATNNGVLVVVTADGELWLQRDGELEFRVVRTALFESVSTSIGDEELLLEVEDQIDEIVSDVEEEVDEDLYDEDAEEDAQEELASAISDSAEEAVSAAGDAAEVAFDYAEIEAPRSEDSQQTAPLSVWLYGEHLWSSSDEGLEVMSIEDAVFHKVLSTPVFDLAHTEDGWLAATMEGVVSITYSDEGFDTHLESLQGNPVYRLLEYPGYGWLAGGSEGVSLRTREGWSALGGNNTAVTNMVWTTPGTLMVVTGDGVERRSAANQFQSSLKIPGTFGFTEMLVLDDLHILATSPKGVFESVDGGYRYAELNDGLWIDGAASLVNFEASLLLGSEDGLFSLNYVDIASYLEREDEFPSLHELVEIAAGRVGMAVDVNSHGLAKRLMPNLSVEAYYQPAVSLDWGEGDGTTESPEGDWRVFAGLGWGGYTGSERSGAPVVVGGELYQQRTTDLVLVSSRLNHEGRKYKTSLSDQLGKLYTARAALIARELGRENHTLLTAVLNQLKIVELEAQISVLVGDWVESSTQL